MTKTLQPSSVSAFSEMAFILLNRQTATLMGKSCMARPVSKHLVAICVMFSVVHIMRKCNIWVQCGKVFVRTLLDYLHIFSPKLKLKSTLSFSFSIAFSLIPGHLSQLSFHPLDHGVAQPCVPFRKLQLLSLDVLWMGAIVSGTQRERQPVKPHTVIEGQGRPERKIKHKIGEK